MTDIPDNLRAFRIQREVPVDTLYIQKLNEHAQMPSYGSASAAGMDLLANLRMDGVDSVTLEPGARRLVKTGLAVACPKGHYARVAPRSGLAYKSGIDVLAGVVDEDYRGDVGIILLNTSREPFTFHHGDRVAQLVIEKYTPCLPVEVESLSKAARGSSGFGSTGTN